jgi:altronate dehydratase
MSDIDIDTGGIIGEKTSWWHEMPEFIINVASGKIQSSNFVNDFIPWKEAFLYKTKLLRYIEKRRV